MYIKLWNYIYNTIYIDVNKIININKTTVELFNELWRYNIDIY